MITVIATYQLPKPITRDEARKIFLSTAPKYQGVSGLVRKCADGFAGPHGNCGIPVCLHTTEDAYFTFDGTWSISRSDAAVDGLDGGARRN